MFEGVVAEANVTLQAVRLAGNEDTANLET